MKRKITVTHEDLDAALAVPGWSCNLCLIAQAGYRQGFRTLGAGRDDPKLAFVCQPDDDQDELDVLMDMFDSAHGIHSRDPMMAAMLEVVLPMEFEVEVVG
jgi:hypothetical protein